MSDPVPPSAPQDDGEGRLSRWPRSTSDLHESLASHEAAASRLRQELDDLRRTLDTPPAARPAPRARSSRRLVLGAVAATILVLALGVVLAARGTGSGAAGASSTPGTRSRSSSTFPSVSRTPAATSTTTTPGTPPPTATPKPSATSLPSAAPLPPWPGEAGPRPPGLPAHGVGADLPGTEVTAAVGGDRGPVEIYQRAVLAPGGSTLTLRPATSKQVARSLGAAPPTITDLHAAIDGRPVPVTGTPSGWTVPVPSTTTPVRLTLRYRLTGALVRTEPAPRGRYNLVLTPLSPAAASGADARVVVRIRDPRVDEVYCPETTDELCGSKDGPQHVATVPAGSVPIVVGLVTFPS